MGEVMLKFDSPASSHLGLGHLMQWLKTNSQIVNHKVDELIHLFLVILTTQAESLQEMYFMTHQTGLAKYFMQVKVHLYLSSALSLPQTSG